MCWIQKEGYFRCKTKFEIGIMKIGSNQYISLQKNIMILNGDNAF